MSLSRDKRQRIKDLLSKKIETKLQKYGRETTSMLSGEIDSGQ